MNLAFLQFRDQWARQQECPARVLGQMCATAEYATAEAMFDDGASDLATSRWLNAARDAVLCPTRGGVSPSDRRPGRDSSVMTARLPKRHTNPVTQRTA
jgi:hypothetical protein